MAQRERFAEFEGSFASRSQEALAKFSEVVEIKQNGLVRF
jgi:hypothetical protein